MVIEQSHLQFIFDPCWTNQHDKVAFDGMQPIAFRHLATATVDGC